MLRSYARRGGWMSAGSTTAAADDILGGVEGQVQERQGRCRECGAELPPGSAFCNRCGANQAGERPAKPFSAAGAGGVPPEETLWMGRYSLKAVAHLWLLWALWMALVLGLYVRFVEPRTALGNELALALAVGPVLWSLAAALLRKLTLRYRLTNHRLFTDRGIFARQHDELELIRVDDVSVRQNLLQ